MKSTVFLENSLPFPRISMRMFLLKVFSMCLFFTNLVLQFLVKNVCHHCSKLCQFLLSNRQNKSSIISVDNGTPCLRVIFNNLNIPSFKFSIRLRYTQCGTLPSTCVSSTTLRGHERSTLMKKSTHIRAEQLPSAIWLEMSSKMELTALIFQR